MAHFILDWESAGGSFGTADYATWTETMTRLARMIEAGDLRSATVLRANPPELPARIAVVNLCPPEADREAS